MYVVQLETPNVLVNSAPVGQPGPIAITYTVVAQTLSHGGAFPLDVSRYYTSIIDLNFLFPSVAN